MRTASGWLYVLAVLEALSACVGGIVLMTRTGCTPNPYNDAFGTDLCSGHPHPLAGIGAAVLLGGLVNAAVIAVIGRLCGIVADLREYRNADACAVVPDGLIAGQ